MDRYKAKDGTWPDDSGCPVAHVDMDAFYARVAIRKRWELVPGSALQQDPSAQDVLAALELRLALTAPLRDIAARLHVVARRSVG